MTPEQIDDYCKRLAEAWKKDSYTRLGELISKSALESFAYSLVWNVEDEALITAIEKMVENGK